MTENEKFEKIKKIKNCLVGCSNHNCYIKPPVGMGTNGVCHCLDDKTKVQRFVYIANYERDALKASKAESDKEIADLTTQNEQLREALEQVAYIGIDNAMGTDREYFMQRQLGRCIGIASGALASKPPKSDTIGVTK